MLMLDSNAHIYSDSVTGEQYLSVTQVLPRPEGLSRASLYDVEQKRLLGSAVAKLIELDLMGTLPEEIDAGLIPWRDAWRECRDALKIEALLVEKALHSVRHGVAGKLDLACYFRARLSARMREALAIVDAKCTCAAPAPATALQTAGYQLLLEENYPWLKVKERHALWLRPEESPRWRLIEYKDPNDRQHFLCALDYFCWKKDNGYDA